MYFSKEFLLDLYKKLSSLYSGNDIEAQGGTQFVSELKYFLAMDYFKKQKGKTCDSNLKDDKDFFVLSVGKIVLLSEDGSFLATKNFANSVGEARDFDVGSNFFSANAVAVSKKTDTPQKFPNRHPQLLSITRGIIDTYSGGYENLATDAEYFGRDIKKYAILFLWLNRFSDFTSKDSIYTDSLFNLQKTFSSELVSTLQWTSIGVKNEVEKLLSDIQLVDSKQNFTKEDLKNRDINRKVIKDIHYPHNRIVFGAPGTGKSHLLEEDRKHNFMESCFERVTFHPNSSYAQFVGTYKPTMSEKSKNILPNSEEKTEILSVLINKNKTAQEKYDLLYDNFKGESLTRLPILLGLYDDGSFHTRKADGTPAANDNIVERNHGKAIRPYVNLNFSDSVDENQIKYEYVPGAFMRVYRAAKLNPSQNFLLLIEEINRANVAAVFGDVFQLLDRDENGVSEYPVAASEDIKNYLAKNGIHEDELRIPSNMYIWATMNSADQGVFLMDTAFKRRWEFEYIGINKNSDKLVYEDGTKIFVPIPKGNKIESNESEDLKYILVEWDKLRQEINNKLSAIQSVNEDKWLGPFFIGLEKLRSAKVEPQNFIKLFKSKVLMYLYEDVVKINPTKLFVGCGDHPKYSTICEKFDEIGVKIFDITWEQVDSSEDSDSIGG